MDTVQTAQHIVLPKFQSVQINNDTHQHGRCLDANQHRCAVGASLLYEQASAASLLPLFDTRKNSQRPKILVLER